jgi:hypothetical protein
MQSAGAADDGEYLFLRLSRIDFEEARESLALLARYRRRAVRYCILRDVIVTYARPFSRNRDREGRPHQLKTASVPLEMRRLHHELIRLRDQAFAHSDHEFRRPNVTRIRFAEKNRYFLGFSIPSFDALEQSADEIQELIAHMHKLMETRISSWEGALEAGEGKAIVSAT